MRIKLLLFALVVGAGIKMTAQVEDVSIFITPTASYNWFDSKSTVKDGAMYGVQAGFGFGKSIELRGIYEQSSNLDQKFGKYLDDLDDLGLDFSLTPSNVKVRRVGGEFKANIPTGDFSPYLILGSGVQTYKRKFSEETTYKTENIYVSGGLGFKINLSERLTLNFEGRAYGYNMRPSSLLADPGLAGDLTGDYSYEEWLEGQKSEKMFNYSLNAGLQLYLGGRNEEHLSAMDRAYKQRFGSGLSGFKVTFAPMGAYVKFDNNSAFRNTYLLGGELGIDFTDLVGIRAYYLQSTEDEKISLDFDKLAMYGADFVGRLNVARGISPYITVGGGYIDVTKSYVGEISSGPNVQLVNLSSKYYAKGGVGMDVPLGKRVDLFAAANILYTTDKNNADIDQIEGTDQLRNHIMYNAGFRIKLGKNIDTDAAVDRAFDDRFDPERRAYDKSLDDYDQRIRDYDRKVEESDKRMKSYKERINELESDLKDAFDDNDEKRASEIIKEKKYLEGEIQKQQDPENPLIRMTPSELESLIDKVLKGVEEDENKASMEERLDRMEDLLIRMNQTRVQTAPVPSEQRMPTATTGSANDRLIEEISKLQQKLGDQENTIAQLKESDANRSRDSSQKKIEIHAPSSDALTAEPVSSSSGFNFNKGMALFVGPSFGDATNFNIGVRSYHAFSNTTIMFSPDISVGFGSKMSFGVNANGLIPISLNSNYTPYLGAGVGLNYIDSSIKIAPNFIGGVSTKVGDVASVYLEYTARGAFKNNQIALGYRFRF